MIQRFLASAFIAILSIVCVAPASAGGRDDGSSTGHIGISFSASTTGLGLELAAPIGNLITVRGGVSYMPGFTFHKVVNGRVSYMGYSRDFDMDIKGNVERTQGNVIVNIYPFLSASPFYVAAGAYFGGRKILGLDGHTDALQGLEGFLELGEYELPVDKEGNARGALKVNSFRPYLGVGLCRPVSGKRVNLGLEAGVQFMGTMTPYAGSEKLTELLTDHNDGWQRWIDRFKAYPVIKLTISGKLL